MQKPLYPEEFRRGAAPRKTARVNRRKVTMPERVGPYVRLVFAEMARLNVGYQEIEDCAGVRRATVKAWRKKNAPGLESLQAVLGFLGHTMLPVPALETLPPELAGEVTALALKMQRDIPSTWAAMVAVGVEQALLNMTIEERRSVLAEHAARGPCQAANDNAKPERKAI